MLEKRRKMPMCAVCGRRRKGFDHSGCKQQKATEAASFRTPKAQLLDIAEHPVRRKKEMSARGGASIVVLLCRRHVSINFHSI